MLTLEVVPYSQIQDLTSVGRIRKLLNIAKEEKIVVLQGRLKKDEEAELIRATMEEINADFKGIELAVIDSSNETVEGFGKVRKAVTNMLLGDQQGLTIIGPATIVKEIKKDPNKIQLFTGEEKTKKRRNNKK